MGETLMAIVKVIEVLAESTDSWEDAARKAVAEASKTVRNISSIYVKEFQATVENNQIRNFRINGKISFLIEGADASRD
jgi:flavin-binding protein dodecin